MTTTPTDDRSAPGSAEPAADAGQREILVRASHMSKRFTKHHRKATSFKERLIKREHGVEDDFWALRDIDLVVARGETVGLTGPNGSGKSTLLKVLSGILRPNEGEVQTVGRVASLLELGAGFDGELTGRENVYLNSALLGVPRSETDRLFDTIVDFSELGEFIDYPVKHYSSGMYVRLGFAVAVHVDPDILIVDEVLAVGDAAFQQKCLDRIRLFQQQGKTILFVSHSSGHIESLCSRAVLLNRGRIVYDGTPRETVSRLEDLLGVDRVQRTNDGTVKIAAVALVDPSTGTAPDGFEAGSEAMFMANVQWLVDHELPEGTRMELSFVSGGETVAHVAPQERPVARDEPLTSGGTSEVFWHIHAMPALAGSIGLRFTLLDEHGQLATAEIPGILVHGTTVVDVGGTASMRAAPTGATPAPPLAPFAPSEPSVSSAPVSPVSSAPAAPSAPSGAMPA